MPWSRGGTYFDPTDDQVAAWRCPRCHSTRWVGYGMWPGSGPVKAQCVPCGAVSDWPETPVEARETT